MAIVGRINQSGLLGTNNNSSKQKEIMMPITPRPSIMIFMLHHAANQSPQLCQVVCDAP